MAQLVKNQPAMQETWVPSLGWEDPLEKGKATHSSILAWRILKELDTTEHIVRLTLVYYTLPVAFPQLASYIFPSLWPKMDLSLVF